VTIFIETDELILSGLVIGMSKVPFASTRDSFVSQLTPIAKYSQVSENTDADTG
jgi:hypothetical protein